MRKTIRVDELRDRINANLASDLPANEKAVLCSLLEHFLMDTGNYNGFRFLLPLERAKVTRHGDADFYNRQYG